VSRLAGSIGPFLLPVAIVVAAGWLGRGAAPGSAPTDFRAAERPIPGTLRIAVPANPPNLDPVEATDTTSDGVLERMGATLLRFDPELRLVPDMTESLPEVSADGLTYTFRLREGIRFHPWTDSSGATRPPREVTAEDVRYSLVRLLEPWSKRSYFLTGVRGLAAAKAAMAAKLDRHDVAQPPVEGIEVVDARTLRIHLDERNRYFPYFLAMNNAMVVPREAVADLGLRFGRAPVSAGPFRLVEWKDNYRVVFERAATYHGRPSPLDRVVFYVIPGEETAFQAYLNGDLEIIQAPYGKVQAIRKSNIGAQLLLNPLGDVRFHGFNMERAPLGGNTEKAAVEPRPMTADDKRRARLLRQAFNCAVDREALCEGVLEGRAVPARGVVPPGMRGHDPGLAGYRYDPERAKALLAEAGYPEGKGLPVLPYHFNSQPPNAEVAQAIQADLKRVGIVTELHQMDWGAYQNFVDESRPPSSAWRGSSTTPRRRTSSSPCSTPASSAPTGTTRVSTTRRSTPCWSRRVPRRTSTRRSGSGVTPSGASSRRRRGSSSTTARAPS
jgi:ABC-type transport system substrate-binding protein